ncbi:MAG: enoyl-CoA hydratase-related protein [Acidimicrobiales bacterium]
METITVGRDQGVVTVTLNRPEKLNALNDAMWDELAGSLSEVARNPADRVLVLTGAGGAFCSGADLADLAAPAERSFLDNMRRVAEVVLALHRLAKPTIAKVNGVAAGAGANLALGCDLIVASERARFSQIFARRGLSIDAGGSWLLPRLVGLHRAKELALLGDMLSADEAAAMGLVNRAVPEGRLDGFVADWAARLAAGPPIALSLTKALLNNGLDSSFDQALEAEAHAQSVNATTDDFREAVQAFLKKRAPHFRGR